MIQICQKDKKKVYGAIRTGKYGQAERWAFLTAKRRGVGKQIITSYDFDEGILPLLKVLNQCPLKNCINLDMQY